MSASNMAYEQLDFKQSPLHLDSISYPTQMAGNPNINSAHIRTTQIMWCGHLSKLDSLILVPLSNAKKISQKEKAKKQEIHVWQKKNSPVTWLKCKLVMIALVQMRRLST